MKTIRHAATLFYYDGPQVFEGRDEIGGHYIAVMVQPSDGRECYLVAGVEPEQLRQFRTGMIDLRSLLLKRAQPEWYLGTAQQGLNEPLLILLQDTPLEDSPYLPELGFVLHDHPATVETLKTAQERQNLVLEVAVEPPESAQENRIHVPTLVELLAHVQNMLKHAYASALRELTESQRRNIDRLDAHLLDVIVPAAAGSFRVVFEAASRPDLFGHNDLARALDIVDDLFENVADPPKALETAKLHRGHLASSYLRLLQFLVKSDSGLRYRWAEPQFVESRGRTVTRAEAAPLADLLATVSNLAAQSVVLVGALKKADVDSGTWRLATHEGNFSGKTQAGGPTLAGLRLESNYRFTCIEEIAELEVSLHEQRSLLLTEYEPA
jgi:hypothetical protein